AQRRRDRGLDGPHEPVQEEVPCPAEEVRALPYHVAVGAHPARRVDRHRGQGGRHHQQEGKEGGMHGAGGARGQAAARRTPIPLSATTRPISAMGTSCRRWYDSANATALSLGTPSSTRASTAPTSSVPKFAGVATGRARARFTARRTKRVGPRERCKPTARRESVVTLTSSVQAAREAGYDQASAFGSRVGRRPSRA